MLKTHKKQLIAASLVTLLPTLVGLLLRNRLPEVIATHFGPSGRPDSWSPVSTFVFIMPLTVLALFWLCVFFTLRDPGNKDRNQKPLTMVLWTIPLISNLCCGMMFALALGVDFSVINLTAGVMGLLFVIIGNYMPKCQMNATIGIKVFWTYSSEENWNATHRFAGRFWVFCGIAVLLSALLPTKIAICIFLPVLFLMALVPIFYSWRYYRRQLARGDELKPIPTRSKKERKTVAVVITVILAIVAGILFLGNVEVTFGDTSFTIDADMHSDLTVEYADVDTIEFRDGNIPGYRVMGFGSAKLLLGYFENDEFGTYTRYTYTNANAGIVITVDGKVLVISGKDYAETQIIFDTLRQKTGK